jgi:hypothetical protein
MRVTYILQDIMRNGIDEREMYVKSDEETVAVENNFTHEIEQNL